ncbi:MAG: VOC family protein [Microthrixaceae bacterium]
MDIHSLGYLGIGVHDVQRWRDWAGDLGTMVVAHDDGFGMRIDDRPFRILVESDDTNEGLRFVGWEVADAVALAGVEAELAAAGVAVEWATTNECEQRRVRGLLRSTDPTGVALEFFYGAIHDHEPFVSPTGLSGFVTGAQGLGHIVLGVPRPDEAVDFYTRVLGLRVSDYWRPGDEDVVFLRCNSRHHSLALVPASEAVLHHFMLEARSLDDVGATLDRHRRSGLALTQGLGRHTNYHMVSFYGRSPSGFDVEFGCGGRQVDEETWVVSEITKPSAWGHHPPSALG